MAEAGTLRPRRTQLTRGSNQSGSVEELQNQVKSPTSGTGNDKYTLVDIKSGSGSTTGKRPNTRSNERKSRQTNVGGKSTGGAQNSNTQGSMEASFQSRKAKQIKSSALNEAHSSIQASDGESGKRGEDQVTMAGMINELSSNVPLTNVGEVGEWRPQQTYETEVVQQQMQIGAGILAASGEPKQKTNPQQVSSGVKHAQPIKQQSYSDKLNSNLRKRNQTGSNHRITEPHSAKQNSKVDSDNKIGSVDMPAIQCTPNLGQNLSHARVQSYQSNPENATGSAFAPVLAGPLTSAEYRDSGYEPQIIAQASQVENGQMAHSAFTSFTSNSMNTSMTGVAGRALQPPNSTNPLPPDYQSAGFGFIQQNGQANIPSTFQFTSPQLPQQQQQFYPQQQQQQQQQQQPQVHFIANKQKFYGISPERAQQLMFNTGANNTQQAFITQQSGDKRPFTAQQLSWITAAGGNNQVFTKRQSAAQQKAFQQQAMMAQLYLGGSTAEKKDRSEKGHNLFYTDITNNQGQQPQPVPNKKVNSRLAGILGAYSNSQPTTYSQSVPRRTQTQGGVVHSSHHNTKVQREQEQLYEEVIRLKQLANVQREENVKLKTKVRVMETDMVRKERTLEDFVQHSQYLATTKQAVVQAPTSTATQLVPPVGQSATRYQQETFLVISLKKQIKELKLDLQKRDEELLMQRRNVRHTKFYEMETEIKLYKEELARLRHMLENVFINQQQLTDPQLGTNVNQRANNSAFEVQQPPPQNQLRGTELKNSFSEPPTTNMNSQPLSELNVMANTVGFNDSQFERPKQVQNELTSMSEHVEIMSQTQTVFGGPGLTTGQQQVYETNVSTGEEMAVKGAKSVSGLNRVSRQSQQHEKEKKELSELKNALTKQQQENSQISEKAKQQFKELTRVKKTLKDKEKDVERLKNFQQTEDKTKQLEVKVVSQGKQVRKMEDEIKKQEEELLRMKTTNEAKVKQVEKMKKENISVKKSLEDVIEELKKEVEMTKKKNPSIKTHQEIAMKPDDITSQTTKSTAEKAMRIKSLQMETLDELSLLAEQVCYAAQTDRVDCAEIIMQQLDSNNMSPHPDQFKFKGLQESISNELKELLDLVSVQEFACMLPKCRSSTLSRDDREDLMIALRKHVTHQKLKEIKEREKVGSVSITVLRKVLDFSDPREKAEIDMRAETAYRLVQILYFDRFFDGQATYNLIRLAADLTELSTPSRRRAESSILEMEKEGSLGEKSIMLKDEMNQELKKETPRKPGDPPLQDKDVYKSPVPMDRRGSSAEDERMLDVAEGCFIRLSELLLDAGRTVRGIFTKFSQPEIFPDNTVLELLSPMSFLGGIREAGFHDLQEVEAACLMKVLAKPELDNHIILNELVLIMENFGVHDNLDDDEEDDYIPDSDGEGSNKENDLEGKPEKAKGKTCTRDNLDMKGIKILTKLARFLLKQFVHPREFFGQCIKKTTIETKKKTYKIDTLLFKDFYLRMKIASIRKKLTPNESLNTELCVDRKKHPEVIHVKSMVKILEEIAENEQELLMREEEEKKKLMLEEGKLIDESTFQNSIVSDDPATPKSDASNTKKDGGAKMPDSDKNSRNATFSKSLSEDDSKGRKEEGSGTDYISAEQPEMLRFGNARTKPPTSANRACKSGIGPNMILGTIEEDKAETQTSNYQEGLSEREDSKLYGSNQLRGSNILQDSDMMEENCDYRRVSESFQDRVNQSKGESPGPARSVRLNNSSGKRELLTADQAQVNQINEASEFNEEEKYEEINEIEEKL